MKNNLCIRGEITHNNKQFVYSWRNNPQPPAPKGEKEKDQV